MAGAIDSERRAALNRARLGALVAVHTGVPVESVVLEGVPGGAVAAHEDVAWYLADEPEARSLGRALAWWRRRGARELRLICTADDAALARQAAEFDLPVRVERLDGDQLAPLEPSEPPSAPPVPEQVSTLVAVLEAGGVEVVVEDGVVRGEVRGLEVARIVVDEHGSRLEVGVGAHDREAFQLLYGDEPAPRALARVAEVVGRHRQAGAEPHPLNRMGADRWMRSLLLDQPRLVGATALEPLAPVTPRTSLLGGQVALCRGDQTDGSSVVVGCAVGISLDLVPLAAEARRVCDPEAELVVALPERDRHPIIEDLAAALHRPARVVSLPAEWRSLGDAAARP